MLLAFAQLSSDLTSEKTRAGRLSRASDGYHSVKPPFGTMPGPEKGVPVPDPERWPWLVNIFELAANGNTNGEILEVLRLNRVRSRPGGEIGHTSLNNILENRFYLGEVSADGQWYAAKHQCRIDPELWQSAQKKRRAKPGPPQLDYIYLLDGHLVSSHFQVSHPIARAGRPMPYQTRKNQKRGGSSYYAYMRADRSKNYGGVEGEPVDTEAAIILPYLEAPILDEYVVRKLLDYYSSGEMCMAINETMASSNSLLDKLQAGRAKICALLEKLQKSEERLKRKVLELIDSGLDSSLRAVDERLAIVVREIADTVQRLKACDSSIREVEAEKVESAAVDDNMALLQQSWEEG